MDLLYIDTDKYNVIDVVRCKNDPKCGCLSKVYVNDKFVCYGLEPFDRGFKSDTSLEVIKYQKSVALNYPESKPALRYCAIPTGIYDVDLHHINPKYSKHRGYKEFNFECPQVMNVKGFQGVNIHIGNFPQDTRSCLLLGELHTRDNGRFSLMLSTENFQKFFRLLRSFKYPVKIRYSRCYVC